MEAPGLALMAGYSVLLASLASQVAQLVPQPYMDEIFHIPQAQAYCAGRFFIKLDYFFLHFQYR